MGTDQSQSVESDGIRWVSANDFIETQTREFSRNFTSSRPRPRNRAMGFKGDDKPKRPNRRNQL